MRSNEVNNSNALELLFPAAHFYQHSSADVIHIEQNVTETDNPIGEFKTQISIVSTGNRMGLVGFLFALAAVQFATLPSSHIEFIFESTKINFFFCTQIFQN